LYNDEMSISRLVRKLVFPATAALVVVAGGAAADPPRSGDDEKLLFTPNLSDGYSSAFERSPSVSKKANPTWVNLPQLAPHPSSYWNAFGTVLSTDVWSGNQSKLRFEPRPSGSANAFDQFKLGDSYLGVETKRRLQPLVPFQRSGCTTDEECEDYSGLPKSKTRGSAGSQSLTGRHLRKPFLGLSVTTPIQ
jgi:hypothetical protein